MTWRANGGSKRPSCPRKRLPCPKPLQVVHPAHETSPDGSSVCRRAPRTPLRARNLSESCTPRTSRHQTAAGRAQPRLGRRAAASSPRHHHRPPRPPPLAAPGRPVAQPRVAGPVPFDTLRDVSPSATAPLTRGRRLLQRLRPRRPRRRHRRLHGRLPGRPAGPAGRARRRRTRSAARASTCGCIPTKACSSRPTCTRGPSHADDFGITTGETGDRLRRHRQAPPRRGRPAGPRASRASSRRTRSSSSAGRGRLDGGQQGPGLELAGRGRHAGRRDDRPRGDRRDPRHRQPRQEPARPRPRRHADRHQRRRPARATACRRASSSSAPAPSASSSPAIYHDLGVEVTLLEYLPGRRAARGPRGGQELERALHPARDRRS